MLFALLLGLIVSDTFTEPEFTDSFTPVFPAKNIVKNQSISPRLTNIGAIVLVIFGTAIIATLFFVVKPAFDEDIAPLINQE